MTKFIDSTDHETDKKDTSFEFFILQNGNKQTTKIKPSECHSVELLSKGYCGGNKDLFLVTVRKTHKPLIYLGKAGDEFNK